MRKTQFIKIFIALFCAILFYYSGQEYNYTSGLLAFFIIPSCLLYKIYFMNKKLPFSIINASYFSLLRILAYIFYLIHLFYPDLSALLLQLILVLTIIFLILELYYKQVFSKTLEIKLDTFFFGFFIIAYHTLGANYPTYFYIFFSIILTIVVYFVLKYFSVPIKKSELILFSLLYFFLIQEGIFAAFKLQDFYHYIYFTIPILIIMLSGTVEKIAKSYLYRFSIILFCFVTIFSLHSALDESKITSANWKKFAKKTGNESCLPCHNDITVSYSHSQMGRSMMRMTEKNLDLNIDTVNIYDDKNNYYYTIEKEDSGFFMHEKRYSENNDLIHDLSFKIDYIVGSGNNTKSFLMVENDYVYEMPLTYYSNKEKWDLSPGYRNYNIRFFREANQLCMDCHNAKNDFVEHSNNRFTNIPEGIDCEQCHGPASLHIDKQLNKNKLSFDPIHNPEDDDKSDLVCYDCHPRQILDGLSNDEKLEFTAHSTRLSMSKCYIDGDIKCMDCHDPHLALEETKSKMENSCFNCHSQAEIKSIAKHDEYDNCTTCHMPRKGSSDIPHVSATDHFIAVHNKELEEELSKHYASFFKTNNQSKREKEKAKELILSYREQIGSANEPREKLRKAISLLKDQLILEDKYKFELAKAYHFQKQFYKAEKLFSDLENNKDLNNDPDFFFLYANNFLKQKKQNMAKSYFQKVLNIYPDHIQSLLSLSSILIEEKNYSVSIDKLNYLLKLIPFNENALYQKSLIFHLYMNNRYLANKSYELLFKYFPDHYLGNINYANFLFDGKLYDEAISHLSRLYKRGNKGEQLMANLVRFYFANQQEKEAKKLFNTFKKEHPNSKYISMISSFLSNETNNNRLRN